MTRTHAAVLRGISVLLVGWFGACEEALVPPECTKGDPACEQNEEPVGCVCADIYQPVCGKDGITYGNACEAGCANVPIASEGECKADPEPGTSCICPAIYKPVCGDDGKTYGNACEAACAKTPVAHEGTCDGGIDVSCQSNADCANGEVCYPPTHQCEPECSIACFVYDPVCGTDGKTYGCGEADAHCHGVEVASPGECKTAPCACTKEYLPVCGADGTTYGNACMAKCARVEIAHDGSCGGGGCSYAGKRYAPGDSFPADDGCNTCSCTEGGFIGCTEKACLCDYDDPARKWVQKSPEQCQLVKFACPAGQRPFFNECGCGCELDPVTCRVGGCSGQLCVGPGDPDISTCEWRDEYACYKAAKCELQASGSCGWTQTDALRSCIEAAQ